MPGEGAHRSGGTTSPGHRAASARDRQPGPPVGQEERVRKTFTQRGQSDTHPITLSEFKAIAQGQTTAGRRPKALEDASV